MTTPRTNAADRIKAALGIERLSQSEIAGRTGMTALGVKSALNAMVRRREVRRLENGDNVLSWLREAA